MHRMVRSLLSINTPHSPRAFSWFRDDDELTGSLGYPLLSYSHYTEVDRAEVPSFQNIDSTYLAIYFGSQGYIVAAADYLGLGDSPGYHPYFNGETLRSAAFDMLRASVAARSSSAPTRRGTEHLFLTGYSEGGSTNMFLHRYLELEFADEFPITASAPMAGPYDLPFSVRQVISHPCDVDPRISSAEVGWLIFAFQQVYGGIYSSPGQVFNSTVAPMVATAFDGLQSPQEVLNISTVHLCRPSSPILWRNIYREQPPTRFCRTAWFQ